jgi:hypothetical protein
MQLVARTLRYLAGAFLADPVPDRAVQHQRKQNTARTNAAEANVLLQQRRLERDEVAAYLESRILRRSTVNAETGQDGRETRRVP